MYGFRKECTLGERKAVYDAKSNDMLRGARELEDIATRKKNEFSPLAQPKNPHLTLPTC